MDWEQLDRAIAEFEKNNPIMNIYTAKGERVVFLDSNGYDYDLEYARKYLVKGTEYVVDKVQVDMWRSDVILQEYPNKSFCTAMFANVSENPKLIEDKNDYGEYSIDL